MKFLLDTCVVSDFGIGDRRVVERLKTTTPTDIAISVITWFEVEYGLRYNPAKARRLRPLFDALRGDVGTLSFEPDDALQAAALRADLRSRGTPIGAYDVLLAGCALNRGLTMVTSNLREFSRIPGLTVENWRQ